MKAVTIWNTFSMTKITHIERLSERSGLRMSVPTYRTNILYEDMIRYDERGITYTNQKVLAANGSVACLNPTLGPQPSLM